MAPCRSRRNCGCACIGCLSRMRWWWWAAGCTGGVEGRGRRGHGQWALELAAMRCFRTDPAQHPPQMLGSAPRKRRSNSAFLFCTRLFQVTLWLLSFTLLRPRFQVTAGPGPRLCGCCRSWRRWRRRWGKTSGSTTASRRHARTTRCRSAARCAMVWSRSGRVAARCCIASSTTRSTSKPSRVGRRSPTTSRWRCASPAALPPWHARTHAVPVAPVQLPQWPPDASVSHCGSGCRGIDGVARGSACVSLCLCAGAGRSGEHAGVLRVYLCVCVCISSCVPPRLSLRVFIWADRAVMWSRWVCCRAYVVTRLQPIPGSQPG